MTTYSLRFHQLIDKTLKQFNISGRELADRSGIGESAISRFRRGEREMQTDTLERMIEALPSDARNYLLCKILIKGSSLEDLSDFLHAIAHEMRSTNEPSVQNDTQLQPELVLR